MTDYQFVVDGVLSARVLAAFPDLHARIDEKRCTTTLFGTMDDPTAMRTILARLDDLGLTLLEMRRLPT
ncbi:hypothetical protein [Rhodococcus phenolicus]|uniref:hypothetical protein n=1 Tax=Rhodococcus phenolicus TaxID=263849 RepID=UPI00082C7D03|nr:hypothetical protein [Rhodococcus phenolicus]